MTYLKNYKLQNRSMKIIYYSWIKTEEAKLVREGYKKIMAKMPPDYISLPLAQPMILFHLLEHKVVDPSTDGVKDMEDIIDFELLYFINMPRIE